LAHDLATGAIGIKDLVKKAEEGPADRIDLLAAVRPLVGLRQEPGGQQRAEQAIQVHQALRAEVVDVLAQASEAWAPGREERSGHNKYIYLLNLDSQSKMNA
jgi:hypothetical protein